MKLRTVGILLNSFGFGAQRRIETDGFGAQRRIETDDFRAAAVRSGAGSCLHRRTHSRRGKDRRSLSELRDVLFLVSKEQVQLNYLGAEYLYYVEAQQCGLDGL